MPTITTDSVTGVQRTRNAVRITNAETSPPLLPLWLRVAFRLDVSFRTSYHILCDLVPGLKKDADAGTYLWYKEVNDLLEKENNPNRLIISSREGVQHYVSISTDYDIVFVGNQQWGRKIFTTRDLMTTPIRKYRAIPTIFSHSESSMVLPKRVSKTGNLDTIGLEIEIQIPNCNSGSEAASKIYNEGTLDIRGGRFVLPCHDGSIGPRGVEYKTGIFDMTFWDGKSAAQWREVFHNMKFKAYTAPECGLHINLGRNNTYGNRSIVEMVQAFLFSAYWNGPDSPIASSKRIEEVHGALSRIAGRDYLQNRFCSGQGNELGYIKLGTSHKYQPLRFGNDRVEFRIFQSTTNPERLRALPEWCIELGRSVKRLQPMFNRNLWDMERDFRAKWGQLVFADLHQRAANNGMINWLNNETSTKHYAEKFKAITLPILPDALPLATTDLSVVDESSMSSFAERAVAAVRRAG